jgi:hypothetical protein
MKCGWGRWNNHSQPLVLLVSLLYRKNIHNPDAIPEHDKECCVCGCDMHATYPVAKVFSVSCGQGVFELDHLLLDDPSVLSPGTKGGPFAHWDKIYNVSIRCCGYEKDHTHRIMLVVYRRAGICIPALSQMSGIRTGWSSVKLFS